MLNNRRITSLIQPIYIGSISPSYALFSPSRFIQEYFFSLWFYDNNFYINNYKKYLFIYLNINCNSTIIISSISYSSFSALSKTYFYGNTSYFYPHNHFQDVSYHNFNKLTPLNITAHVMDCCHASGEVCGS